MSSLNKVQLIGNVGRDPEIRVTQAGMQIANLTLATSEKRKGEEVTEWHRLIAFDKTAGVVDEYVRKGTKLYVEGRIQTRKWTDKDDVERYTTEILVDRLLMLGGKPEGSSDKPAKAAKQAAPAEGDAPFDDEIPF